MEHKRKHKHGGTFFSLSNVRLPIASLQWEQALEIFVDMVRGGFADCRALTAAMDACVRASQWQQALHLYRTVNTCSDKYDKGQRLGSWAVSLLA